MPIKEPRPDEGKLYRLQIVEKDTSNELVKIRYIGYDSSYDEWRPESDIVDVNEEDHIQEDGDTNSSDTCCISGMIDNLPRFEMQPANSLTCMKRYFFRLNNCSVHRERDILFVAYQWSLISFTLMDWQGMNCYVKNLNKMYIH